MTRLGALTSPEVAAGPSRVLVVPVGSIEQHGPHLPLDTDVRIAEAVAARIVEDSPGLVLGPTLPVGAAGEHASHPREHAAPSHGTAAGGARIGMFVGSPGAGTSSISPTRTDGAEIRLGMPSVGLRPA